VALTRSLTTVLVLALIGCGNGTKKGETVNTSGPAPSVDAGIVTTDSKATPAPSKTFEPALPSGVKPFAPTEFVAFVGFTHGNAKPDVSTLVPTRHPTLGTRSKMEIMGSDGFRYEGHFAVSWQTEDSKIDYISVRSDAALAHLAKLQRSDARLQTLWGISPEGALGVLGQPSDIVERSHAWTFRFDFDNGGRKGTLSLEFSKLDETTACSAVSVHWLY
jgi:hypothetical protein